MGVPTVQESVERVYRDCGTQLWRGVYAFSGGRRDIADDAVAEAFARALESGEGVRSLLPWLYRVAFRQAARRLRDEGRQGTVPHSEETAEADAVGMGHLVDVLMTLTPKQRAIVFLFYYADFPIADIASATGSTQVAVRVQLHRARASLRRRYGSPAAMRERLSPGGNDDHELA